MCIFSPLGSHFSLAVNSLAHQNRPTPEKLICSEMDLHAWENGFACLGKWICRLARQKRSADCYFRSSPFWRQGQGGKWKSKMLFCSFSEVANAPGAEIGLRADNFTREVHHCTRQPNLESVQAHQKYTKLAESKFQFALNLFLRLVRHLL